MKTAVIAAFVLALAALCSPAAKAWNCTQAGQIRVQVPAGTVGNGQGDGPGQVDTVEGITFQCQTPPTAPPPSTSGSSANAASNANSASTASSNSNSSATGGNATSTATGGNQKQNQKQNQSQTATGGNATGGNASAQGGTATASGNGVGNGNNSNNYSNTTNVPASAASAYAPPSFSTATCFKGFSGGASAVAGGISFGGGKIDQNCAELEAARQAPNLLVFCEQYIKVKYVKAAGVTLEQCMQPRASVAVQVNPVVPAQVQPVVVNVQPAAPVVVPAPEVNIIVPAAPAPSVVVRPSKPRVPSSSKKCVQKTCPPVKPTVWDNDKVWDLQNHS